MIEGVECALAGDGEVEALASQVFDRDADGVGDRVPQQLHVEAVIFARRARGDRAVRGGVSVGSPSQASLSGVV